MRVLMTIDGVGGVFTYAIDLIKGLRREGVDVGVVCLGSPLTADQRAALHHAGPAAFHERPFRLEWMEDPWSDLEAAGKWLLELEDLERPDVVHAGSFFCGGLGFHAPVVVVGHSCVYSWWHAVHGCDPPAPWQRYRDVVRRGLSGAAAIVAPSRAMLTALERHYGPLRARAHVIPNGSSHPKAVRVAKEHWVLGAGRVWDAAKNLSILDGVAQRLDQPVVIAGDLGTAERSDDQSARAAGARRLGRLPAPALSALRRRAAVFAAPALYEPFGLSVLEAARDGCALVLGDIPSFREVWDDAAVYVPPSDVEAITHALRPLLEDPAAAASLGRQAQRHAGRYSVEAMSSAYASLYRTLTGRPQERLVAA